jgi:pantoate--beta-alanine ligase
MSSRNAYLTPAERAQAAALPRAMRNAVERIEGGQGPAAALTELQDALRAGGFASVDYAELCDAETLAPLTRLADGPARLLVAARIGRARLIDNMAVGGDNPAKS